MRTLQAVMALALGFSVAAAAGAQAPAGGARSPVAERVRDYLERCALFGWSGVGLVAQKDAIVFEQGFGFADRATGRPNDPDTLFEIASATKPFTACAVMRLVETGKLALDDPIAKHLPGVPADKRDITVRHLLAHTSGMPRSAAAGRGPDLEAAVKGYLGAERKRRAGDQHEYWNGGYALLAGIVERATGKSFQEHCKEEVFRRAGLESTGFTGDDLPGDRQAVGYDSDGKPVRAAAGHAYGDYGYQYRGMGGLVTSARELWRFVQAYEAGKVLSRKSVDLMQAEVDSHYGLGWGVTQTARKTRRISHGGDVKGFHTQLVRFPDEGCTIVVLSNVEGVPPWKIAWNLEAVVLGGKLPYPEPPRPAALTDEQREALCGAFASEVDGRLVVERAGLAFEVGADGITAVSLLRSDPIKPDTEKALALGRKVIDAVIAGQEEPIRQLLRAGIPESWPHWLVTKIWPEHLADFGAIERIDALSVRRPKPTTVEVVFGLRHGDALRRVKLVFDDHRLSVLDFAVPEHAHTCRCVAVSPSELVTFDWDANGPGSPAVIRFSLESGRATALVLRGPSGKEARYTRER